METIFQHRLSCPWCAKGEVLSNTSEKVIISVQCSRCRRVFWADLHTLKTARAQPQRRAGNHIAD